MTARVYGTVKDSVTGAAITTATVVAPPYNVVMNNGTYSFTTAGACTVTITASDANYISQNKSITLVNGQNKLLNFMLVHV